MNKLLLLLLCASCPLPAGAADFTSGARGSTGAQFLELPAGARAIAMGSAYTSISGDPFSAYYNPAGLAGTEKVGAGLMHAAYLEEISYEYGVLAVPVRKAETLGVSVQYLAVGKMQELDKTGAATGGSFRPDDLAVSAIYAARLGALDLGLAVKRITSRIRGSASSFAGDLGLRARSGNYAFGLSVLNLGKGLKFHQKESPLPETARVGASVRLGYRWLVSIDGIAAKGAAPAAAAGAEYKLVSGRRINLAARAGYNSRPAAGKAGGLTGLSAGAGLELGDAAFDYAWSPCGDLGATHRFSVGLKFGGPY